MATLERFYFPFFMAIFMSGLMSIQLLILNNGLTNELISLWLHTWPKAFVVAFPSAVLVSPIITKICLFLKTKNKPVSDLKQGAAND